MARFIRFPWATTGDRAAVPFDTDPGGSVSYSQGFGPAYEIAPGDPGWKPVPRDETNGFYYDLTDNLRQYQLNGVPDWHPAADNGGIAISYPVNALVRWNDLVYMSISANNTVEPGTDATKWRLVEAWTAATTATFGVARLATNAEARAKTAADRVLTPSNLPSIQTGILNTQYITASGDFVVPAGVTRLFVRVIAGGGGGGGANTSQRHGGGGGGGGVAEGFVTVTPGDTLAAVVGTGGGGGALGTGDGSAGGSSSFAGLSATGGGAGRGVSGSGAGGNSGVGSGGSLNYGLGDGGDGNNLSEARGAGVGGGAGGNQGRPGQAPGAGGGGAYDSGGGGSVAGGAGASGLIVVAW